MALLVVAATVESTVLYVGRPLIGGSGFGVAFLGGLLALTAVIPAEHRAARDVSLICRRIWVDLAPSHRRRRRCQLRWSAALARALRQRGCSGCAGSCGSRPPAP